jgi:hypothetical protein
MESSRAETGRSDRKRLQSAPGRGRRIANRCINARQSYNGAIELAKVLIAAGARYPVAVLASMDSEQGDPRNGERAGA